MSTRRARIKAVTALPPRRKNIENADNIKPNPTATHDAEKQENPRELKDPKQQLGLILPEKSDTADSLIHANAPTEITSAPTPTTNEKCSEISTITEVEKVQTVTSTSNAKSVFLSPQARNSPHRRIVISTTPRANSEKTNSSWTPDRNIGPDQINGPVIGKNNTLPKSDVPHVIAENKKNGPDDYAVLHKKNGISESSVMDGIIPLQSVNSAPKPIDLLKNEIISEYAEVLFDPIVPLPSPSKVRPKLRPVPRLGPLRRNSVQGSASESEDENRRALLNVGTASVTSTTTAGRQRHDSHTPQSISCHPIKEVNRIRNDSVCSSMSQITVPAAVASPLKEKHYSKSKKHDLNRRTAAMRRRREAVKRDGLTMYDLIFCNPTSKPMVPDQDEIDAREATEKEAKEAIKKNDSKEDVDDLSEKETAPVPQMKLGPNGEIVLDEQSLVIKSSDKRLAAGVVREGAWSGGAGGAWRRRRARTADWADEETVRFYRALAALGTDFMIMEQLFPGRTRQDLKKKFKKEERLNGAQIDKALKSSHMWDASKLQEEFVAEREAAKKEAQREKDRYHQNKLAEKERNQAAKELKIKHCKSTRAIGSSIHPSKFNKTCAPTTANEIIEKFKSDLKESKRRKNEEQTKSRGSNVAKRSNGDSKPRSRTDDTEVVTNINNGTPLRDVSAVIPRNIETGSLVVLTVEDPNAPSKKILQTYISNDKGALTPVALPSNLLNSVVGYMNKGTPKSNMSVASSPSLTSPSSVVSQEGRSTSVIQMNSVSPFKRQRHSSYTITPL